MMKKINFILGFVMVVLMAQSVLGDENVGVIEKGGFLLITDVDVKVDGKSSKNLEDGETIDDEAFPGATVKFDIELFNNFTDESKIEIEDVELTITIEGIDDDDDLDEEEDGIDINEDDNEDVTIEFELPIEIEDGNYDVVIEAEGDTDDNGTQRVTMKLTLDVEKEKHELRFTQASLTPSKVVCQGSSRLSLTLLNTGEEDEDDVEIVVSNSALDLEQFFMVPVEIEANPYDDDSKYSKTFTIEVPEDARAGTYQIAYRATYDSATEVVDGFVDLVVEACEEEEEPEEEVEEPEEEVEEPEESEEDDDVEVIFEPVTPPVIQPPVTDGDDAAETEEKSFFESPAFIALFVGAEILIIIIVLVVVLLLLRRRNE